MYKYLDSLERFGINMGLDRIQLLLEKLDDPHRKFKSIHVAGTNGKGSTCAMIASILKEAGYKVGLYTSPHLFDYRERIKVNGRDIPKKIFEAGLRRIERIVKNSHGTLSRPTVFEVLTALAFWYFAKMKVDYAVIEVGLGGRLDATNVITPLVSVITNVDLEHTEILGRSLAKIAAEKAGIVKLGIPVVTAEEKSEPLKVIKDVCKKKKSFLIAVSRKQEVIGSSLLGEHQRVNAACAVAAIRLARIKVSREAIRKGLRKTRWPGRFQIFSRKPLTILDGAHNPAGIKVLVDTLKKQYPRKKFTFIFGTQEDKDSVSMLALLKPLAKRIIITHSSHPNAAKKDSIELEDALKQSMGKDRVITGSLFLVADVLRYMA